MFYLEFAQSDPGSGFYGFCTGGSFQGDSVGIRLQAGGSGEKSAAVLMETAAFGGERDDLLPMLKKFMFVPASG